MRGRTCGRVCLFFNKNLNGYETEANMVIDMVEAEERRLAEQKKHVAALEKKKAPAS